MKVNREEGIFWIRIEDVLVVLNERLIFLLFCGGRVLWETHSRRIHWFLLIRMWLLVVLGVKKNRGEED